jgi:MFS family permease
LAQPLFRALWIATIASNVGTWIQDVGAAWLMTTLAPSPMMVALVRAANSLPLFLLALPAGALADVVDRRRLLLFSQLWMLAAAAALGLLTLAGLITPALLLALTFALGIGAALNAPAWQAIVPEIVPPLQLREAVSLNSLSVNLARAVGPAIGGLLIAATGPAATFLFNAVSFFGVIVVLYRWKRAPNESVLPAERVAGAMRAGLRYVRHAPRVQVVLLRSAVFVLFASALWSLLPVMARFELGRGPAGYGILLGFFGLGAVAAATVLPRLRRRWALDRIVGGATVLFALVVLAFAGSRSLGVTELAMAIAGAAWITVLSSFNASLHALVAGWVRGRAMAFSILVFFGGMAVGSALWGSIAAAMGPRMALTIAGVGMLVGLALTARYRLRGGKGLDLSPSVHWPAPVAFNAPQPDQGPVVVTVEYTIDPDRRADFVRAMGRVRRIRRRDGAISWGLLGDVADPARFVETFVVESWLEHLRQHERVTVSDRAVLDRARAFHVGREPVRITHFLLEPLPEKRARSRRKSRVTRF